MLVLFFVKIAQLHMVHYMLFQMAVLIVVLMCYQVDLEIILAYQLILHQVQVHKVI